MARPGLSNQSLLREDPNVAHRLRLRTMEQIDQEQAGSQVPDPHGSAIEGKERGADVPCLGAGDHQHLKRVVGIEAGVSEVLHEHLPRGASDAKECATSLFGPVAQPLLQVRGARYLHYAIGPTHLSQGRKFGRLNIPS